MNLRTPANWLVLTVFVAVGLSACARGYRPVYGDCAYRTQSAECVQADRHPFNPPLWKKGVKRDLPESDTVESPPPPHERGEVNTHADRADSL